MPATISSMISRAFSWRGLSEVTMARSARRDTTPPINGRLPLSRLPPQPNTQISCPRHCSRKLSSTFSRASGVWA
ncbi:conserved hypothetical protein [Ricinus communis]|uniref:Uncharacterized protein n=1 Tax=Ricinus communis TaxID=3988 RepID=B9TL43_RICCO|nr:conserved hypothetical protein [Ricinus communis]